VTITLGKLQYMVETHRTAARTAFPETSAPLPRRVVWLV
jgi:hypothetical protein